MESDYLYEPSKLEVVLTEVLGNTLLRKYYKAFVEGLNIKDDDNILDYCSGSGIISGRIAKKLKNGRLVYTDVSRLWLGQSWKKLKPYKIAQGVHISDFDSIIAGGNYDKIVVHFAIHDFPGQYRLPIIRQLMDNLRPAGILYIREPISEKHGIKLHDIINLLESQKNAAFEYETAENIFAGKYLDIKCCKKS